MMCALRWIASGRVVNCPIVLGRIEKINILVISLLRLTIKRHFKINTHIHLLLLLLLIEIFDVERMLHSAKIKVFVLIYHIRYRNLLLQFRRSPVLL